MPKAVLTLSASVERYFESKFGENLEAARTSMSILASSYALDTLYEAFRPKIPARAKGWGLQAWSIREDQRAGGVGDVSPLRFQSAADSDFTVCYNLAPHSHIFAGQKADASTQ